MLWLNRVPSLCRACSPQQLWWGAFSSTPKSLMSLQRDWNTGRKAKIAGVSLTKAQGHRLSKEPFAESLDVVENAALRLFYYYLARVHFAQPGKAQQNRCFISANRLLPAHRRGQEKEKINSFFHATTGLCQAPPQQGRWERCWASAVTAAAPRRWGAAL